VIAGLPRNDILIHRDPNTQKQMKKKLGIEEGKTVVLYAPTFREYEKDENLNCVIKPPISFSNWKKTLGEDYVVLLRLHYEVSKLFINDLEEGFVVDVSDYPSLNELMLASDALITDYSSIMFDYSILERPIFIFAYDFEKYKEKRGMYFDIRKELPGGMVSEQELLNMIRTSNYGDVINQVKKFRDRYVTFYGNATEATVDRLYAVIKTKGV
jgi:CDP-glycerol glycerophosphotransferase